jgi:hypothetical protein
MMIPKLNNRGSLSFSESLALKAVSLLLALILWITILGFKQEELKLDVKLEPLLAPSMMITNRIPSHVQFTFAGPRVLLKDVERKVQPIRPDLRRTPETTIGFAISEDLLGDILPRGVRVTGFFPPNILIRLEEIVERYVDVRPALVGKVAADHEIAAARAFPPKVAVSGPRGPLQMLTAVSTEPFDVEGLLGSKEGVVGVEVDPTQGFQLSRDKVVRVRVNTRRVQGQP